MTSLHAKLSPSSAHRWITCPASVRASAGVPDRSSAYAEEGTRAHTLAELEAATAFGLLGKGPYLQRHRAWLKEATEAGDDVYEMIDHAYAYVTLLRGLMDELGPQAQLRLEQRVDTGVPDCWGTADAVIITPDVLQVVDFKYGRGVQVSAAGNPQTRLYGVGALDTYDVLGDLREVRMTIHQPRLDWRSTEVLSKLELLAWREDVRKAAEVAQSEDASFNPSESACRFCPVAGDCRARMEYVTRQDFTADPGLLTPEELADALTRAPGIRAWLEALEKRALERAFHAGEIIPGWKVVMSGGQRKITDKAAAIQTLIDAGFTAEQVSRIDTKTLTDLDRLVKKAGTTLEDVLGDLVSKTPGREALVTEDDRRPAVRAAENDFSVIP